MGASVIGLKGLTAAPSYFLPMRLRIASACTSPLARMTVRSASYCRAASRAPEMTSSKYGLSPATIAMRGLGLNAPNHTSTPTARIMITSNRPTLVRARGRDAELSLEADGVGGVVVMSRVSVGPARFKHQV